MIQTMILAAGRGERMRPLTDTLPKPLLPVNDKPLIVHHIERLAAVGITDIVINHAWLGERLETELGDGSQFDVAIQYSPETAALETAGGIAHALPLLGDQPFLVINGDVWCDWNPMQAVSVVNRLHDSPTQAWLLMVDNPEHHPEGDFSLDQQGYLSPRQNNSTALTYAGIGVFHPSLFRNIDPDQPAPLAPLLRMAMATRSVEGYHYTGRWTDVGTPARLAELDRQLRTAR